ncbi:spore coat U domain-containing protein [Polaromonas sp.]|uniref:Csu type fimbrial protein n=1 Tax=Polaromonas sp. TaxID=1869339 RepID=UPI00286AF7E2|nr:spore coat U domain-containing protein [Polaromonas sp.]
MIDSSAIRLRLLLSTALGLWLALSGQAASAQVCTTSAVAPVFGNYLSTSPGSNAAGSVSVSCVVPGVLGQNVFYSVKLGLSGQAQGTQRRMGSAGNFLAYNVFCDSGYNQIWADGTGASCVRTGGQAGLLGTLLTVYPLYGRIPGGQFVSPGSYSDNIAIEVLY